MKDCVFCRISNKESPATIIYEDPKSLAFLDIHPVNIGHVLVIPKKHAENIFNISEEDLSYLSKIVKKMAHALKETFHPDGVKIVQSNGDAAGQVVNHLHVHVIPFYKERPALTDDHVRVPREENKSEKDLNVVGDRIRKNV